MAVTKYYFQADPGASPPGPPAASYRGNLRDHLTEDSATYSLWFFPLEGSGVQFQYPGIGRDTYGLSYEFKGNKRSGAGNIVARFTNTFTNYQAILKVLAKWNLDNTDLYYYYYDAAGQDWNAVPPHDDPTTTFVPFKCKVQGVSATPIRGTTQFQFNIPVRWIT